MGWKDAQRSRFKAQVARAIGVQTGVGIIAWWGPRGFSHLVANLEVVQGRGEMGARCSWGQTGASGTPRRAGGEGVAAGTAAAGGGSTHRSPGSNSLSLRLSLGVTMDTMNISEGLDGLQVSCTCPTEHDLCL